MINESLNFLTIPAISVLLQVLQRSINSKLKSKRGFNFLIETTQIRSWPPNQLAFFSFVRLKTLPGVYLHILGYFAKFWRKS